MAFGAQGAGFNNPPVAGQGAIARPDFKSINYSPGVSGWAIFRNGNAEFNNGTFRGIVTASTFQGTDFLINPSGSFYYSGTPATGNLIASITTAAGTDTFGNDYLAGFTSYYPSNPVSGPYPTTYIAYNISTGGGGIGPSFPINLYAAPAAIGPWTSKDVYFGSYSGDNTLSTAEVGFNAHVDENMTVGNILTTNEIVANNGLTDAMVYNAGTLTAPNPESYTAPNSFSNGWAQTAGRGAVGAKRVAAPDSSMLLVGSVTVPAGFAAGNIVCTFPTRYATSSSMSFGGRDTANNNPIVFSINVNAQVQYQSPVGQSAAGHNIDFFPTVIPLNV
jgi:hypothetical protein